jgi:hypothetical protein
MGQMERRCPRFGDLGLSETVNNDCKSLHPASSIQHTEHLPSSSNESAEGIGLGAIAVVVVVVVRVMHWCMLSAYASRDFQKFAQGSDLTCAWHPSPHHNCSLHIHTNHISCNLSTTHTMEYATLRG